MAEAGQPGGIPRVFSFHEFPNAWPFGAQIECLDLRLHQFVDPRVNLTVPFGPATLFRQEGGQPALGLEAGSPSVITIRTALGAMRAASRPIRPPQLQPTSVTGVPVVARSVPIWAAIAGRSAPAGLTLRPRFQPCAW